MFAARRHRHAHPAARADAALNRAKARDGGTQAWWELAAEDAGAAPGSPAAVGAAPGRPAAPDAAGLVASYKERLFAGGLEMFMQPAVDIDAGVVYLFESLARLRLEDGSLVPPAAFLPQLSAAETDRLFRLGLDQVLGHLAAWGGLGPSVKVSVNIAPSTLLHRIS